MPVFRGTSTYSYIWETPGALGITVCPIGGTADAKKGIFVGSVKQENLLTKIKKHSKVVKINGIDARKLSYDDAISGV